MAPGPGGLPVTTAEAAVTALYQAPALGLTRLAHIRFSSSIGWQEVLWANADGSALVVTDPRGKQSQYGRGNILGVLSGNKLTPIPHSAYTVGKLAW